jgi:predicted RNA-binding protein with PUA domain
VKNKLVVVIAILIVITGFIAYQIVFEENKLDVSEIKAEHKISANELFQKFENNENLANKSFLGKVIEVTGIISEIQKNQNNETLAIFRNDNEIFGVTCTFKQNEKIMLKPGDKVAIKGTCQGFLTDVVLTNCILVN